jgi:hypothetical protein
MCVLFPSEILDAQGVRAAAVLIVVMTFWRPPAARADEHWVGWQTIASDLTSFGVIFAGLAAHSNVVVGVGVAGMIVGSPIIDAVHGARSRAAISVVARVTGAILMAAGGVNLSCDTCESPAFDVGLAIWLGMAFWDASLTVTASSPVLTRSGPSRTAVFGVAGRF